MAAIAEMEAGRAVEGTFLVEELRLKRTRNGDPYLDLLLRDRTGQLRARKWEASEAEYDRLQGFDYVTAAGSAETFKGRLQLNIDRIAPASSEGLDLTDFLPASPFDPDELLGQLEDRIARMESKPLQALLQGILATPRLRVTFRRAPAAVRNHHAYLGGLLEHVCQMCKAADRLCDAYPRLDRDLLVTGVILHDIGKIWEIEVGRGFAYSPAGELVGHLSLGVSLLVDRARRIEGFPPDLLLQLQHLILSHHGEYEWGSPRRPVTAEALALHHLDNLDAKLHMYWKAVDELGEDEGPLTEYVPGLKRRVMRTD